MSSDPSPDTLAGVPHGSMPPAPRALPYVPLQPTDLTCTCTTYVTDGVKWMQRCIYCQLNTVFGPSPLKTPTLPAASRRRNFKVPNPLQGRMI